MADPENIPLFTQFLATPPREKSGPVASNRFAFQLSWALSLLCEIHASGGDYLLVLDYHDDVIVFDSATMPKGIDFYQVKTKGTGNWSLKDLTRVERGETLSILAKLYSHRIVLKDLVRSLNFVSNTKFSFKEKRSDKALLHESIALLDLCDASVTAARNAICAQHSTTSPSDSELNIVFRTDPLSLKEHRQHAKGRFLELLEKLALCDGYPVKNAFDALSEELKRRADCESSPRSVEELREKKGFSRAEFTDLLDRLRRSSDRTRWQTLFQQFSADGADILTVNRHRRALETYEANFDAADATQNRLRAIVAATVNSAFATHSLRPFPAFVANLLQECIQAAHDARIPASAMLLCGMVLSTINEAQ